MTATPAKLTSDVSHHLVFVSPLTIPTVHRPHHIVGGPIAIALTEPSEGGVDEKNGNSDNTGGCACDTPFFNATARVRKLAKEKGGVVETRTAGASSSSKPLSKFIRTAAL